ILLTERRPDMGRLLNGRKSPRLGKICASGPDPIADTSLVGHIAGMPTKGGWVTAEEHAKRLAADPAYQAMRKEKEAEQAKRVEQRAQEMQPLLDDLAAVGVVVDRPSRLLE